MYPDFGPAIDPRPLFRSERAALLYLLQDLDADEWQLPTICPGWTIHDLALHLLNDDMRFLARQRDRFGQESTGPLTRAEVTALVNRLNQQWLDGARWMSPRMIQFLLDEMGDQLAEYVDSLDLSAIGPPVDWAGPEPALVWLDIAREYTERWVHQQQIRDAANRPGLTDRLHLYPVLDTFARALPHALRNTEGPAGTTLTLQVTGDSGGAWTVRRETSGWRFATSPASPTTHVSLNQDLAWRLFTSGLDPSSIAASAFVQGDEALAEPVLSMVTVLA